MIRPATPQDADQIAAIYNHYVENTICTFEEQSVSNADMRSRITRGITNYPWLAKEHGGRLLGYAYGSQWKSRIAYRLSVESSVYLAADQTGKGLGLDLYRSLIERLKQQEFHCALGGIALPNPASVALHEKLGFRKVGELQEVGWKMGRWVNVGYWELLL